MNNKLVRSLHKLLVEHECVAVPQLGAFIREQLPARWDALRKVAYPPSVVLRFNEALQHQDGLLLDEYASSLSLSQRRAKLVLEQDIQSLRAELVRTRNLNLEGIGTLHLGAEGNISFTSSASEDIAHEYYGLCSVAGVLNEQQDSQRESLPKQERRMSDDYIQIAIPKKLLRYTTAAAVIILLIGLPLILWKPKLPSYEASFVPDRKVVEQLVAEVKPHFEPTVEPQTSKEEVLSLWTQEEQGKYYVIIGTERRKQVAEKYIDLYQEKFPKLQILEYKSIYRISADAFATSDEANAMRATIAKDGLDAWVYKAK